MYLLSLAELAGIFALILLITLIIYNISIQSKIVRNLLRRFYL